MSNIRFDYSKHFRLSDSMRLIIWLNMLKRHIICFITKPVQVMIFLVG